MLTSLLALNQQIYPIRLKWNSWLMANSMFELCSAFKIIDWNFLTKGVQREAKEKCEQILVVAGESNPAVF